MTAPMCVHGRQLTICAECAVRAEERMRAKLVQPGGADVLYPPGTDAHESITLSQLGRAVHFHRYGCPECHVGIRRVIIDADDEKNVKLVGDAAEVIWEMAVSHRVKARQAQGGR